MAALLTLSYTRMMPYRLPRRFWVLVGMTGLALAISAALWLMPYINEGVMENMFVASVVALAMQFGLLLGSGILALTVADDLKDRQHFLLWLLLAFSAVALVANALFACVMFRYLAAASC